MGSHRPVAVYYFFLFFFNRNRPTNPKSENLPILRRNFTVVAKTLVSFCGIR